ncbi:hypothetical protein Tco_0492156 [Tanacetum coccineum]
MLYRRMVKLPVMVEVLEEADLELGLEHVVSSYYRANPGESSLNGVHGVDIQSHVLLTIQSQFSDINLSFVSQQATVSEVIYDVMSTQVPIVEDFKTPEPIVAEVSTRVPTMEKVGFHEFTVEDVVLEDYVSSGEDVEQCNGQFDESAPSDGHFFYEDEGIDTAYETEYDVQSSEDAEPGVDVYLFGISMDLPFDNIGVTNLVQDDVLEGDDVGVVINRD